MRKYKVGDWAEYEVSENDNIDLPKGSVFTARILATGDNSFLIHIPWEISYLTPDKIRGAEHGDDLIMFAQISPRGHYLIKSRETYLALPKFAENINELIK